MATPENEPIEQSTSSVGSSPPARPTWVKIFGIVLALVVVVVLVKALAGGGHGPGRHMPGGGSGHTPPVQHDS